MNTKAYEIITARIIALLEAGTIPWEQPWNGPNDFPKNLVSGKEYRGINTFLLACSGFTSSYWVTFKQAKKLGGSVIKGEKGTPCIFWNFCEVEDKITGKIKKIPFIKYFTVFNVEQCKDIEYPKPEIINADFSPLANCEAVVSDMPQAPEIKHAGNRACYFPGSDSVNMPNPEFFSTDEGYYSVLFHELTHSTGHESRVGRSIVNSKKSDGYAKEELTAEMGAAFLCGHTSLKRTIDNSASYISGWLRRLRDDSKLIVQAAAQAQKAVDFILDIKFETSTA